MSLKNLELSLDEVIKTDKQRKKKNKQRNQVSKMNKQRPFFRKKRPNIPRQDSRDIEYQPLERQRPHQIVIKRV